MNAALPASPLAVDDDALLYKQVFDTAIVGICFMRARRFIRVNRRMEELLGYAPGELIGRSVRVVYARRDDYAEVGRLVTERTRREGFSHERALLTRTGELRWCLIGGRWLDPDDPDSASVWVVQDITAKKATEDQLARAHQRLESRIEQRTLNLRKTNEALKAEVTRRRDSERAMIESREKYRVLLRHIPLGIAITDAEGALVEINPVLQGWFGVRSLDGFVQLAEQSICQPAGDDSAAMALADVIRSRLPGETRRPGHLAFSWRNGAGTVLWFDVVGVRVPVSGLGSAVVFADQTAMRQARDRELSQQQQLAHASRLSLMGQFAAALAHELGQPLNASLSYAAGIERHLKPALAERPEAADALSHLQLQLRQAGDVIRNVRAFVSRHRASDEPVDLVALIHATLELLQPQLRDSRVRLRVDAEAAVPKVRGNRVELQQVLINLIVNGIDALRGTPISDPEVRVALGQPRAGWVQIAVLDNGPGVPATLREQIFEPYHSTKHEGLGMGLTLCRNIVESHGGRITLDRRRVHGAAFRFLLPEAATECAP